MNDLEKFVSAIRECGHPHAPEMVDRLTAPKGLAAAGEQAFGEGEQYAIISTPNATVIEGDKEANLTVLISSEQAEQHVEGIALTIRCDHTRDTSKVAPIAVTDPDDAFGESLWNAHPSKIAIVSPGTVRGTQFICIPFMPPFGEIMADGVVCNICIDTSEMKAGEEYKINTAAEGRSSAVSIVNPDPNMLHYTPVHLEHSGGSIKVVAKSQ